MSQRKASATGAAKPPRKKIRWKRILPFYLMALPGFIYMIINNYLPMFGIVIAFKKLNFKKGIWGGYIWKYSKLKVFQSRLKIVRF